MSLQSMSKRVNSLHRALIPPPHIIDCTGARDELLAQLRAHMTEEELNRPVEWSEEDKYIAEKLSEYLAERVKELEEVYNVRLVSYDEH